MIMLPNCACCCKPCCRTVSYSYDDSVPPAKWYDECPGIGGCGEGQPVGDCAGQVLEGHLIERFCKVVVGESEIRAKLLDGSALDDFGTIAGVATTTVCGQLGFIQGDHDITDEIEIITDPHDDAYWLAKVPFRATNAQVGGPYGVAQVRICWCCKDPESEEECDCCAVPPPPPPPPCNPPCVDGQECCNGVCQDADEPCCDDPPCEADEICCDGECVGPCSEPCHDQENPGYVGDNATWFSDCIGYQGVLSFGGSGGQTLSRIQTGSRVGQGAALFAPGASPFIGARSSITRPFIAANGLMGFTTEEIPVGIDDCNGNGTDCNWADHERALQYVQDGYRIILWQDAAFLTADNQIGDFLTGIDGGYTSVTGTVYKYRAFVFTPCDENWQDKTGELLKRTELRYYNMVLNGMNAIEIEPAYYAPLQPGFGCEREENPLP